MAERRRRPAPTRDEPQLRAVDAVRDRARALEHPAPADRVHQRVVEPPRPLQVGHLEPDVVEHQGVALALSTSRCLTSTNMAVRSR